MQTSILVQSLGTIGFIVNVMSDFLQILEVRPERERDAETQVTYNASCLVSSVPWIALFIPALQPFIDKSCIKK